jgi:predicted membrane-bound spermidine synthase
MPTRPDSTPARHATPKKLRADEPERRPRTPLLAIVFLAGAAVMSIEILGTRIVGPVFGVNLFVWSALLTVTLAALAAGYFVGGVIVDRRPSDLLAGLVVLAAGALLGFVPPLRAPVLRLAAALGPRGGPLLSAVLLFVPSLALLGTLGPIAVRLTTDTTKAIGHRVGGTYAVSTAGSLVGTLVTGFALVPAFDTGAILFGIALLLVLSGAAFLALHRRRAALAALVLPLIGRLAPDPSLPPGIVIRERAQSLYGLVEVIEDGNRNVRLLRADHSIIGAQFLADRSPAFSFVHLLETVRFARPEAQRVLQIGLGAGSLGTALGALGKTVDVVEIDPAVVRFAEAYFGFRATGEVHTEDARAFLFRTEHPYDVIVHDTFTGGTTPEHLLSLEVVRRMHALLIPKGIVVLNFVGYLNGPHAEATEAVARTLRADFPNVRAFHDGPVDERSDAPSNLVFFASDASIDFQIPTGTVFENASCERVARSFSKWEVLKTVPEGPLVTDEKNPLAQLELAAADEHFTAMNALLPLDVWLR